MTPRILLARYAFFAVVSTLSNLAIQRAVLAFRSDEAGFMMALFAGTLVGLAVKFALDKRWIFYDQRSGLLRHGRLLGLYATTGIATTVIFWGTEAAFWIVGQSHWMRELGAVVGLTIGYVIKYQLDRRFVFMKTVELRSRSFGGA